VEQCEEACSMFEYEQCRGFNYYTDYGGAANSCSGKGRCELRMEVGFKEAKETWKIEYQGGGGSGPIAKSDGDLQGTDIACYQRQPPPPEYVNVGGGHCLDSSGKYYDSFENFDGNTKICEDSVEQCEEACSMFEYEQCRGFNYYTDYGGAANSCSGKGRCELRMEVGFKEAKETWKIEYQGGGGSGPIAKSDGDLQGTDIACYQRQLPPPPCVKVRDVMAAAEEDLRAHKDE